MGKKVKQEKTASISDVAIPVWTASCMCFKYIKVPKSTEKIGNLFFRLQLLFSNYDIMSFTWIVFNQTVLQTG